MSNESKQVAELFENAVLGFEKGIQGIDQDVKRAATQTMKELKEALEKVFGKAAEEVKIIVDKLGDYYAELPPELVAELWEPYKKPKHSHRHRNTKHRKRRRKH